MKPKHLQTKLASMFSRIQLNRIAKARRRRFIVGTKP